MNTRDLYNKVLINRTAILKNTVAFLLMFVILAFEGCFNFATLGWDFQKILTPAYWVKVGTKVILFLLVKSLALMVFMDVARKVNKRLQEARIKNEQLMKLKGRDFPVYVENKLNPSIKIEAWKRKVQTRLMKLEKHAKLEDRALYFSDKEEQKKYNKYCIHRKQLETELTDEFCKKNYNVLDVAGYAQIDPAVFDLQVTNEKENKYQITAKTKTAIAITLFTGVLMLLISQSVWNAVEIGKLEDYNALAVAIGLLMDLTFLIWNFFTGTQKAFDTVDQQEVLPYINRNRILTEYIESKTNDPGTYELLVQAIEKQTKATIEKENTTEEKKEA